MKKENRFLYGLIVVLIIFLLIHLGIVVFTGRQNFALVSDNYYQQELKYQERIDRLTRANELNPPIVVRVTRGLIQLTYPESFSASLVEGSIRLFRPSDNRLDRRYPLAVSPDLNQTIAVNPLVPGRWKLYLDWTQNGITYSLEKDVYVE
ncbi:MAG: hypothetical protein GXO90_01815 [FCB group bacterium]|nr:hypothetical protein [FCB group bacterium]